MWTPYLILFGRLIQSSVSFFIFYDSDIHTFNSETLRADDMVLFSEYVEGIQNIVDTFIVYMYTNL